MRLGRVVVPLILAGVSVAVPLTAAASPARQLVLAQARGDIKALGPAGITVGHLKCVIPPSMASVGRFVISDPVTIGCQGAVLRTIRYAPPTSAETDLKVTATPFPPAGAAQAVSTGPIGSLSMVWGTIVLGGSNPVEPVSITATGTITSFDASGITIDGQTCSFPPLFASSSFQQSFITRVQVIGKTGTMSCTASGSGGKFSG